MTQEAQVVKWNCPCGNSYKFHGFTEAPQRTWVGLTNEEKLVANQMWGVMDADGFIKTIEAKLKQKNGYAEEKNT